MIGGIFGGWIVASLIFTLVWIVARQAATRIGPIQTIPAAYFEHARQRSDRGYMPSAT